MSRSVHKERIPSLDVSVCASSRSRLQNTQDSRKAEQKERMIAIDRLLGLLYEYSRRPRSCKGVS